MERSFLLVSVMGTKRTMTALTFTGTTVPGALLAFSRLSRELLGLKYCDLWAKRLRRISSVADRADGWCVSEPVTGVAARTQGQAADRKTHIYANDTMRMIICTKRCNTVTLRRTLSNKIQKIHCKDSYYIPFLKNKSA